MNAHIHRPSHTPPTACDAPPLRHAPPFDITSGPSLSRETWDQFVTWAATVPQSHVDVVRRRIVACDRDGRVLEALLDALWKLPVVDAGRHRIILSILGEMKDERAVERLSDFVWHDGELTPTVTSNGRPRPCMFEVDGTELLQSRAAEMLSYIGTQAAKTTILKVAQSHPKLTVRMAAIDAHLYNHGDSREAADELRRLVRASDRPLVGLPRKVRGVDAEAFEQAVLEWYEQNREHRPPAPKQNPEPGHDPEPRSWLKPQGELDKHESHENRPRTDEV